VTIVVLMAIGIGVGVYFNNLKYIQIGDTVTISTTGGYLTMNLETDFVELGSKSPLEFEVVRTTYTSNAGGIVNRQDSIGFKSTSKNNLYLTTRYNETGGCAPALASSSEGTTTEPGWSLNKVDDGQPTYFYGGYYYFYSSSRNRNRNYVRNTWNQALYSDRYLLLNEGGACALYYQLNVVNGETFKFVEPTFDQSAASSNTYWSINKVTTS